MTKRGRAGAAAIVTVTALCGALVAAGPARAGAAGIPGFGGGFSPGNLVVSESVSSGNPGIVAGKTQLPTSGSPRGSS